MWARDLASMIQVALVGFWVGGSFLGLAYWDYPYILAIVLVGDARRGRARTRGAARPAVADGETGPAGGTADRLAYPQGRGV